MSGIRMTGLISGMDTESMVKELVKANSTKVDKVKKEKQLLMPIQLYFLSNPSIII